MVESGIYSAIFLPNKQRKDTALADIEFRSQERHEAIGGEWIEIGAWMADGAGLCVTPLIKSEAEIIKTHAVGITTLEVWAKNSDKLWREVHDLPKLHFLLPYLFFGGPALFLGALEFFNVEVYPDPVQQRPIACSERFEATEEPAVFSFRVSYSEGRLAGSPSSVTGCPDSKRLFAVVGMYQFDVGVPRYTRFQSQPKRIVLGETKVIRVSLIHERKGAGRHRVPCVCRNRIERLSQLCRKRWFLPRAQSIFDPSVRSASFCEGLVMRASPIKPYVPFRGAGRHHQRLEWCGHH